MLINNNVAINEVATLKSVQSRIAIYIMCYVLLANDTKIQQQQIPLISLRSPFNVLHSVLVTSHRRVLPNAHARHYGFYF